MALKFKPGDPVKQVVPVIKGVVLDAAIVDGDVQFKVGWVDAVGDTQVRLFTEAQIEADDAPG